jgi:hypothetical protein
MRVFEGDGLGTEIKEGVHTTKLFLVESFVIYYEPNAIRISNFRELFTHDKSTFSAKRNEYFSEECSKKLK